MENIADVFVGVDVSKNHLDIALYPSKKVFRVTNTNQGLKKFAHQLEGFNVNKIVLEASGGYERLALLRLGADHVACLVNPKRVRDFRNAKGKRAKTDKIDACLIAEFAASECSSDLVPFVFDNVQLYDLFKRKQQLKAGLEREKRRFKQAQDKLIKSDIQAVMKFVKARIKKIDVELNTIIEADEQLHARKKIVESMPGVGHETAQAIVAGLPEAGTVEGKTIASLAGLAPYTNESGLHVGKARIRHGRSEPRKLLYMAATVAIRCNPRYKAFYDRLKERGKPFKVAIVAVMRKMLVTLNAMLRKNEMWQLEPKMTK